jgi:hypothetical protein
MRRAALTLLLFLLASLQTASLPVTPTSLLTKHVVLDVQLDPPGRAFYISAKILLRNQGSQTVGILELVFPAPLGSHTTTTAVWDEKGELAWRSDPVEESDPRMLRVALRSPLKRGDEILLGLNFETTLEKFSAANAPALMSGEAARLATTGWYPLPDAPDSNAPRQLRLVVRLPKEWRASSPVKLRKVLERAHLASYELKLDHVEAGQILFRAWAPGVAVPHKPLSPPAAKRYSFEETSLR